MGIDIVVGIFVDRAEDEDDSLGFYADYDRGFEAINALLRSLGLPEHHEPIALTDQSAFHRTATRELYPFKEIAWHVEEQTTLRFPHLLELGEATISLPLLFETVLELPLPFTSDIRRCSSSYKLYEECRLLAKMLGIYDDLIEDDTSISEVRQCIQDLDQRERNVPFSLISE